MMETTALTPHLGVGFTGVSDPMDDEFLHRAVEALKWRGVLHVPGLHLTDEQQLAFSRRLGEVVSLRGQEIFTVSLDPAKNSSAEYQKGTFHWHLDGTTDPVPVKATTLTCRELDAEGGGTEFASTYAAYEALPEQDRARYEKLRVVHTFEAAQREVHPEPDQKQLKMWRSLAPLETSLVWQRRDGRRSLVIGATADHVVGMEPAESRELLDQLLRWTAQDRFRLTHGWSVGDLVVWDNTGILHRALPYSDEAMRLLHRTTVVGEEPWA